MSPKEFFFALNLPTEVSPVLLRDLVSRICDVACCEPDGTAELTRLVEAAVAQAVSHGDCELRFQAQHGELDVTVHAGPSQIWQTSRPID